MPFNSYPYFVFLAVAVLGFRLLEKDALTARRVFLLLASYAFYAWWRADFLLLLAGSTLVNYALGREIEQRRRRLKDRRGFLIVGLTLGLAALGAGINDFLQSVADALPVI
jgi:D-alanyl-lipoteichoic acid acyltransferase DltB (MBOAT superfamily)